MSSSARLNEVHLSSNIENLAAFKSPEKIHRSSSHGVAKNIAKTTESEWFASPFPQLDDAALSPGTPFSLTSPCHIAMDKNGEFESAINDSNTTKSNNLHDSPSSIREDNRQHDSSLTTLFSPSQKSVSKFKHFPEFRIDAIIALKEPLTVLLFCKSNT